MNLYIRAFCWTLSVVKMETITQVELAIIFTWGTTPFSPKFSLRSIFIVFFFKAHEIKMKMLLKQTSFTVTYEKTIQFSVQAFEMNDQMGWCILYKTTRAQILEDQFTQYFFKSESHSKNDLGNLITCLQWSDCSRQINSILPVLNSFSIHWYFMTRFQ